MTLGWRARAALGVLLVLWTATSTFASPHRRERCGGAERLITSVTVRHDRVGSLIAVVFKGRGHHRMRLLHAQQAIAQVAVRDVDNDGDLDILAAPQQGGLLLWRNRGHGRFALATVPAPAPLRRSARLARVDNAGDGVQLGDERNEIALPRAPAAPRMRRAAPCRVAAAVCVPPPSVRAASGRAPPFLE